ncbi:MAG: mechanosensitive ion channel [Urechidicola sp.]|nr:mechanosensitive ion channel [Urechidicola sp.]
MGVIKILPKLTHPRILIYLVGILFIYLINIGATYLETSSLVPRILKLLQIAIFYFILKNSNKLIKENPDDFIRINKIYKFIAPFYMLILIVAFIANVIGMVGLSRFLFKGILTSVVLLMVLYTSVKIITSIIVLLLKLRTKFELQTVTTIVDATNKRFQPILFWAGMLVWLLFTVKGFEVLEFLMAWIDKSLHLTWALGETIISLGGILSFLTIFTITILIAKLIASIFLDDWMVSILPRGIAPGISLTLRIVLISIGFYIGVSSAGIDLSKLGFIIGALGVGIGFGLQNVVLNFIAGLILAFERPINIGDTIEVDSEFGIVTNIGVRSSNIKTYDGYEAIIPNGDLISKKVVNWTLSDRDRKSKVLFRTASNVDPKEILELSNTIGLNNDSVFKDPKPFTYFKGFDENGNLKFELWYWTTFSEALSSKHIISLAIFDKLKEEGVVAPTPVRRIVKDNGSR